MVLGVEAATMSDRRDSRETSPQKLLLCIDDSEDGLAVRKALFESCGYRVLIATGGPEGIAIFVRHHPDIVILDYQMPDMNGDAVAKVLHRLNPEVPIIMLSGREAAPEEIQDTVNDFLAKADDPVVLVETVRKWLAA
jgi:CheY-like chemotaxis protein